MNILTSGRSVAVAQSYTVLGLSQPFLIKGNVDEGGKISNWFVVNERTGKPLYALQKGYTTAQFALDALVAFDCRGTNRFGVQFHQIPSKLKKKNKSVMALVDHYTSMKQFAVQLAKLIERDYSKGYTIAIPVKTPKPYQGLLADTLTKLLGEGSVQFMHMSSPLVAREEISSKAKDREVKVTFLPTAYFSSIRNTLWDCIYSVEPVLVDSLFIQTFKPPRDGDFVANFPFVVRVFFNVNTPISAVASEVALSSLQSLGYSFGTTVSQVSMRRKIEQVAAMP